MPNYSDRYRSQSPSEIRASFAVLEGYWNDVRIGRSGASSSFDPSAVESVLPYSFVVEEIAPGLSRIRVCGTEVEKLFGQELRGMPINSLFAGPSRAQIQSLLTQAYLGPTIVEANVSLGEAKGRLILLPLATAYGEVIRAMCATIFEPGVHQGVYRMTIEKTPYRMQPLAAQHKPFSVILGDKIENGRAPQGARPTKLQLVVNNPT